MNNSKASIPGQYEDESCVIYIGNLDSRVSDEEIINLFSKYGQVVSLFRRLLDSFYPKEKSKTFKPPRNGVQYGFIRFSTRDGVEAVLKDAKGMVLGKRKLSIKSRVVNPSKLTEKSQKKITDSSNFKTSDHEIKPITENNSQTLDKKGKPNSPKPFNSKAINPLEVQPQQSNKANYTPVSSDSNFKEAVLSLGLEEFSMQAAPTAFSSTFTLTVMNIPAEMTPIDLYNCFKAVGTVKGTAVSQFTDQKGYRYGEVIMDSLEACKSAIHVLGGSLYNGSKLDVSMKKAAYPNNRVLNLTPSTENLWPFPQENYGNSFFKDDANNNGMTWMMGSPTKERYQWGSSAEQLDISAYPKNTFPKNSNALPSISQWESLQANTMHSAPVDPCNLYVKNLDDTVISTKDQLEALFSPFGNITSSMLACYPNSGISKGYGFVAFHRIEEAIAAKDRLNGAMIGKKRIFVCFAERKTDRIRRLQELFADQRAATGNSSPSSIFMRPEKKVPVTIRKPEESEKTPLSSTQSITNTHESSKSLDDSSKTEIKNKRDNAVDENGNEVHDTATPKIALPKEEKREKAPLKENLNSTEIPARKRMSIKSQSIAKNLKKIEEMLNRKKLKSSCFVPRAKATTCTTLTYVTVEPIHYQEDELLLEDTFPKANHLKADPDVSLKVKQMSSSLYQDSNKENFESTVKVGNASPSAIQLSQL